MKRPVALFIAVGCLAGGQLFLMSPAQAAPSAICSGDHVITTSGGRLSYTECTEGNSSRVYGHVKDTDADGQCAYAKVQIENWVKSWKACGEGAVTNFDTGYHSGRNAKVWLSES
ncbi:hypothetical protein [Embleya scabrispora]|uniref:hypothetical protein n=1 Tax=Embleya scabrispora TaxID=159449 RepID=UPI00036193CC|nr:hypothetical protein [Embleya scabrispora]MYS81594.1 hypothetical protein [Streptomyces sp. SID5474]